MKEKKKKKKELHVVPGLAVILLGLVVLAATTTFSCSEVSCGPNYAPSTLLFVIATFIVGGLLLASRRH